MQKKVFCLWVINKRKIAPFRLELLFLQQLWSIKNVLRNSSFTDGRKMIFRIKALHRILPTAIGKGMQHKGSAWPYYQPSEKPTLLECRTERKCWHFVHDSYISYSHNILLRLVKHGNGIKFLWIYFLYINWNLWTQISFFHFCFKSLIRFVVETEWLQAAAIKQWRQSIQLKIRILKPNPEPSVLKLVKLDHHTSDSDRLLDHK